MELYELTQKVKDLFEVDELDKLGPALQDCALNNGADKMDRFVELVGGDLSVDWLQKIFQYNLADRSGKKQDFTPKCLAEFLSVLVGDSDVVVDMCAGSGALTIQRWMQNPDQKFELYEIDRTVVPFLLFNLAVRNIDAEVFVGDVLSDDEAIEEQWLVVRDKEETKAGTLLEGVRRKYGRVRRVESSL